MAMIRHYDGEVAEEEESAEAMGGARGRSRVWQRVFLCAFCSLCALCLSCRKRPTEIAVFYASSLSAVLGDAGEAFGKTNPQFRLRLEPSGSQVAARKVTELGMRADIVAVADASLITKMMIPSHAAWNAVFATNEIVLAHKDHSKFTDQITVDNWPEILTRAGVRLARGDPDTAPIGYLTLMVWQLAQSSGRYGAAVAGLSAKLMGQCAKEHVTHDEAELHSNHAPSTMLFSSARPPRTTT